MSPATPTAVPQNFTTSADKRFSDIPCSGIFRVSVANWFCAYVSDAIDFIPHRTKLLEEGFTIFYGILLGAKLKSLEPFINGNILGQPEVVNNHWYGQNHTQGRGSIKEPRFMGRREPLVSDKSSVRSTLQPLAT
jgi:hypothetical protein